MSTATMQRTFLDLLTFPDGAHGGLVGMSPDVAELTMADAVDSLRTLMEDGELWQTLLDTVRWTTDVHRPPDADPNDEAAFEHLLLSYGIGLITLLRLRGRVGASCGW